MLASSFLLYAGAGGGAATLQSAVTTPTSSTETTIRVTSEEELRRALTGNPPHTKVVLAPGVYRLLWPLDLRSTADLVVRGETAAHDVVIEGPGLLSADGPAARAFVVGGQRVTIANLTIRDFPDAAIVIEPGAAAPRVSGITFIDNRSAIRLAGTSRQPVTGGVIERSQVRWSAPIERSPVAAFDVSGASRLVIRQNTFRDLRSLAGPGITLRLSEAVSGAVVERNTFVDCDQEIVIGGGDRRTALPDEVTVRNNSISRGPGSAGAAVTLAGTSDSRIVHNTMLLNGTHANAVELWLPTTRRAFVRNNLLDAAVALFEGASGSTDGNVTTASPEFFVDAAAGDLHLTPAAAGAIDEAAPLPVELVATDIDGQPRVLGPRADYGADESAAGQPVANSEKPLAVADADTRTLDADTTALTAAGTEATATATSISLPSPWATGDIGSPAVSGSAAYSSGTFTVKGAGADIWGTSDQFRFVYRALSGDGQIVARVGSLQKTHAWAKAGVMMRRSLYAGSPHAFALVSAGSGVSFQQRTVGKGKSSTVASGGGAVPVWLRLVRKGSQFTAYRSADGATWKVMGTTTISMPSTIYVGLAVTSHNASTRTTASVSGVAVKTTSTTTSNTLPTVSVTSPKTGQTFTAPAVVTVTASAADSDGTVSKVEFYLGTTLIGTDTSSPYSAATPSLGAGTYSLTAVAQDNAGGRRTSSAVSITVATSTAAVPKTLNFTPSADHAVVSKYVFEVFRAGVNPSTTAPTKTQDLGKPSVVNGLISASIGTTIQALPSGSYFATVRAVNSAGWTRSAPSNTFTR